ncbi:synaptotagmin-7 isoform X1 [Odontomachus brunneus]|uniref:synaptotagmin-7 isoform X1 n=2 Tax=Odontomachus brunneus TaxID=486640 RepID=UPI0013F1C148|nr:synaptotagmin-7 isoform X1 [Odontomachus brunneus]XP_032668899.1 synaptotagmin-7 isoform X1 [Odontomachus brunneus]XP_032668900.1 synaptotagmin-7 isoform X1 [Odontomachus brunneus]
MMYTGLADQYFSDLDPNSDGPPRAVDPAVRARKLVGMERRDVILTAVFGTLGALAILVGLAFAMWLYLRARKSKQRDDDLEEQNDNGDGSSQQQQPIKKNGFLNLKTPLISTKALGAQLETTGSPASSKSPASGSGGPTSGGAGATAAPGGGASNAGSAEPRTPNAGPQNKQLQNVKGEHPSKAFLQSRSISLVDMYIDNSEPSENVGQIHFSLEYDFQNSTLILRIIQGKDLPAKDLSGTSDPYVRVTLLPDKKHRLETKIKRRTLNPRWNETFYFEGFPIQKLQSRVLHLHVFDYDRFSRDDSIGEMFLPLCQVDLSEKPSFWKALKPPAKDKCGELLCSLCYHPSNSILTLTLLKARNLKAKDINGKSDPYVKVWLQFGDKRIEKRKTPIFKCTLNPIFNEVFSFNVPWEKIRECSLDVMVMDFDNIGRNELIGRIQLAGKNGSGASETKHWQDMITKPRQTIVQWHRLKPE